MIVYYAVTAVFALFNLILFIFLFREKKLNYYILFMLIVGAISNVAYFAVASSDVAQAIIQAKKLSYVGGCFLPPIMLLVILDICDFKVKNSLRSLMFGLSFAVFGMAMTIGYTEFFYKSYEIVKFEGTSVIKPVFGFGHTLFDMLLYGYLVVGIVILIYSLIKKGTVSTKNLWALIVVEVMTIVLFFVGRIVMPQAEITPLIYVLSGWICMYLGQRVSLYNVEDAIVSSLDKSNKDGYILFDNERNFLRCSDFAKAVLPDLAECKIDSTLTGHETLGFLDEWLKENKDSQDAVLPFEAQGKHYECNVDKIWYAKKPVGYVMEIQDSTDRWNYTNLLSNYNTELEKQVQEKSRHISHIQQHVVLGMANMVENRDNNTGGHIKRTSEIIEILVDTIQKHKLMELEPQFCEDLIKAAPMHDLGKIGIDDRILRNPCRLTEEEFSAIKAHSEQGATLVKGILDGVEEEHFVKVAINVARHHHEKWDGTGYPAGLKGEEIPLEARIMAIADVYDALVSKRCYKEPMSFEKANEVMLESMGSHFDPGLKEVYILSREKLEDYYRVD